MLLKELHRVLQHRQVPQGQKVHLQKAQLLQCHHAVLTDHNVVVFRQGHVLIHGLPGNDHPGGVGGGVPGHALQHPGGVDEPLHRLVLFIKVAEGLGQPQGVRQGDVGPGGIGDLLGDLVHLGVGQVHHPSHIPDHAPGGHGAEGDDLGHVVLAVLPADVLNDLPPPGVAKIHVDIRHADPLGVQEALEVEAVFHRVDVRDIEAVADHGPGGAAPARPHGDAHAAGVADEVGDDEEVVREAHLLNHVLLVFQLFPVGVVLPVPGQVALVAELF